VRRYQLRSLTNDLKTRAKFGNEVVDSGKDIASGRQSTWQQV